MTDETATSEGAGTEQAPPPDALNPGVIVEDGKPDGITQIMVKDQNGDHLATVDAVDVNTVSITIGGITRHISNAAARQLRNALHLFGSERAGADEGTGS